MGLTALLLLGTGADSSDTPWVAHTNPSGSHSWIERPAESEVQGWPDVVSVPVLVVDCKNKRLSVFIRTPGLRPELHADLYDSFMARTRQQLDGEDAADQFMRKDIMEETLHFRRARPAFRTFLEHNELSFAFQPFGSDPVETTFDLRGLQQASAALEPGCRL